VQSDKQNPTVFLISGIDRQEQDSSLHDFAM